jgi:chromosomal replication initiation ATPase DnaA
MDQIQGASLTAADEVRVLWDAALDIIRGELNTPTFKTWFEHARPLGMDGESMIVGASNSWGRDWLESRYSGLLAASLTQVAGRPMGVRFVVNGDPAVVESNRWTRSSSRVSRPSRPSGSVRPPTGSSTSATRSTPS